MGLSYDVVELLGPYCFQGYELYVDNFKMDKHQKLGEIKVITY